MRDFIDFEWSPERQARLTEERQRRETEKAAQASRDNLMMVGIFAIYAGGLMLLSMWLLLI